MDQSEKEFCLEIIDEIINTTKLPQTKVRKMYLLREKIKNSNSNSNVFEALWDLVKEFLK